MPSSVTLRLLSTSGQIAVCEDGRNSPIELALDQIARRQFVMREESIAIDTDLLKAGREQSLHERRADGVDMVGQADLDRLCKIIEAIEIERFPCSNTKIITATVMNIDIICPLLITNI